MTEDRTFLTGHEARKIDTAFYAEYEEEFLGVWAVFGEESGFLYRQCMSQEEACRVAAEMNVKKQS